MEELKDIIFNDTYNGKRIYGINEIVALFKELEQNIGIGVE